MEQISGDFDGNGRVNLAALVGCQLGIATGIVTSDWLDACLWLFDADEREDIDVYGFGDFQAVLGGSNP